MLLVGSVREYLPAACPTGQAEHLLLLLLLLLLLYNSLSVGVLSLHLRLVCILGHKFSVRHALVSSPR